MKRLVSLLSVFVLLCALLCAGAAPLYGEDDLAAWKEAAGSEQPSYSALLTALTALADEAQRTGNAAAGQQLVAEAATILPARSAVMSSRQPLVISRAYYQLARIDKVQQHTALYAGHLLSAGLFYGALLNTQAAPSDFVEQDLGFLQEYLVYCRTNSLHHEARELVGALKRSDPSSAAGKWLSENAHTLAEWLGDALPLTEGEGNAPSVYFLDEDPSTCTPLYDLHDIFYLSLDELAALTGADVYLNGSDAAVLLYGQEVYLSAESCDITIDGDDFSLFFPPIFTGSTLLLSLDDACFLFSLQPEELPESRFSAYGLDPAATAFACRLLPDLYDLALSRAQLDFIAGLSAPAVLRSAPQTQHDPLTALPVDALSGLARNEKNKLFARRRLLSDWDIRNSEELSDRIFWLLHQGERAAFDAAAKANRLPAWFCEKWGSEFGKNALTAWDCSTLICLAQQGFCAGYIDGRDSASYSLLAAALAQQSYGSWQDYGDALRLGLDYSLGKDAASANTADALFCQLTMQLYSAECYKTAGWATDLTSSPNADTLQDTAEPLSGSGVSVLISLLLLQNLLGILIGTVLVALQNSRALPRTDLR